MNFLDVKNAILANNQRAKIDIGGTIIPIRIEKLKHRHDTFSEQIRLKAEVLSLYSESPIGQYLHYDVEATIKAYDILARAREKMMERKRMEIVRVIFNDPATIVFWADGTKTVVKATNEDFDPEKGLAMAISKRALGDKANYYDVFKKHLNKKEKTND